MSRRFLAFVGLFVLVTAGNVALARVVRDPGPTRHDLGERRVLGYHQLATTGRPEARTRLAITPLSIRKGMLRQLERAGYSIDEEHRDLLPYYLDVRYENLGPSAVADTLGVGLKDDEDELIGNALLFNFSGRQLPECPQESAGILRPGERVEKCTLYLVDEDRAVRSITFLNDRNKFVYWKAG